MGFCCTWSVEKEVHSMPFSSRHQNNASCSCFLTAMAQAHSVAAGWYEYGRKHASLASVQVFKGACGAWRVYLMCVTLSGTEANPDRDRHVATIKPNPRGRLT